MILWLLFGFLLQAEAAEVTSPPRPVYGMQGDSVNLTCTVTGNVTSDPFSWKQYITDPVGVKIFTDPPTVPLDTALYEIYGRYTLNIKSLDWERNGGVYSCDIFSDLSPHTAHVFVFQPLAMTSFRMEHGQKNELLCESQFGAADNLQTDPGITEPVMTMDVRGVVLSDVSYQLVPKSSGNPWILRGKANYTADMFHDGEDFRCTVTIQEPFAQISNTVQLDILYQVQIPEFAPYNAMYYVGEYINCTAGGNPEPSYEWRSIDSPLGSDITYSGSQLQITEEMMGSVPGMSNEWECTASNILNGNAYTQSSTIKFEVAYNPNQPNPNEPGPVTGSGVEAWKIAVGVCVPLAIIVLVAVGVFLWLRHSKKKKEGSDYMAKSPPPEVSSAGTENPGASLPSDGDLVNGKPRDTNAARTPISMQPNPLPPDNPANRSRDSPGYADLGVKQITGSYPGMNVSMSSSMESFDDGVVNTNPNPTAAGKPPAGRPLPSSQGQPASQPESVRYVNASFVNESPSNQGRPPNPDIRPNHPDTFV